MLKKFHKYFYCLLVTMVLLAMVFLCIKMTASDVNDHALTFRIHTDSFYEEVTGYDDGNGNYYIFLPSYAQRNQMTVSVPSQHTFTLDGTALEDGMGCGAFELDTPYKLEDNGKYVATLWFRQSANVATMHIDTVSGSMDRLHQDKEHEEKANLTVYTKDGTIDIRDELVTLEGHGNTTWGQNKKPYTMTLDQSSSILNMGFSRKWVLLANGFDKSHLRNKIVYDYADAVSSGYSISPDCTYVEIYFNGEYGGLYLLCQKIDTTSEALQLDPKDYYFELTFASRTAAIPTAFNICESRSIDVMFPKSAASSEVADLQKYIKRFQNALFAENGIDPATGVSWTEYIDVDSWARKYLVEEIFSNFDSGKSSQFFLLDASNQKIYAGHYWDYDLSIGKAWATSWSTPYCMLAQRNWGSDPSWYYALCQQEAFMERVVALYESEFRPLLQHYANEEVRNYSTTIAAAVSSEYCRWKSIDLLDAWPNDVDFIVEYLQQRIAFLDSLWLDQTEYCSVTFETSEIFNIFVPKNSVCDNLPQPSELGAEGIWYLSDTKEPFDMSQPITEDIVLTINNGSTVS